MATFDVQEFRQTAGSSEWDEHFEVIDGIRVELPPMGAYANVVANLLMIELSHFNRSAGLGRVFMEMLYRLPTLQRQRRPDVSFVSYYRWPVDRPLPSPDITPWDVVPELAVEVISPIDFAEEVLDKTREYLRAGVTEVWNIYPRTQEVHRWKGQEMIPRFARDTLDGGDLLPGFQIPVATLFPAHE